MAHLGYSHQPNESLAETMFKGVRRALVGRHPSPTVPAGRRSACRRLVTVAGYLFALVIQFALLWLLAELVEVAHGVMELWLELANQHLDLLSLYNQVRT